MHPLILLALAILPGLFIVHRYYSADRYRKEPRALICKSFLWGAFIVIPAAILESALSVEGGDADLLRSAVENFLVVALTEEFAKYLVIRLYAYRDSNFDEVMDGIVYGAAVAAGFATFENIFYVLDHGFAVAMLRAVVSVPGHILWGASIGYWMARVKFGQCSLMASLVLGLGASVAGHGFFDFAISSLGDWKFLGVVPVLLLSFFMKRYIRDALRYDAQFVHHLPEAERDARDAEAEAGIRNPYLRRLLGAGSRLMVWMSVGAGLFLGLGCYVSATETAAGFAGSDLLLVLVPFASAAFFSAKARRYRGDAPAPYPTPAPGAGA